MFGFVCYLLLSVLYSVMRLVVVCNVFCCVCCCFFDYCCLVFSMLRNGDKFFW